jgi:hypothetical protein
MYFHHRLHRFPFAVKPFAGERDKAGSIRRHENGLRQN